MKYFLVFSVLISFIVPSVRAQDAQLRDHELVSAYEGSSLRSKNVADFDEYTAFAGMDESSNKPTGVLLRGKVTKMIYRSPKGRSILEMFENYRASAERAGAEILYECDQSKYGCVKRYAQTVLGDFVEISAILNSSGQYLLAKIEQNDQTAFVVIAVGEFITDIHIVEVQKMDTGMVTVDAAALGIGLDADGYVVVEGIYFATDKATLKPKSDVALQEVATLLKSRPDLKVFVVGHTDMSGSFNHNMALSSRRAASVIAALSTTHAIAPGRLEAHGVGPLAPQSSNASDTGKAKNRRVVLVAR